MRAINQSSVVGVVIGHGGYNEMGLVRSCGEAGMSVAFVAPEDIIMPIYKSKYISKWYKTDIVDSQSLMDTVRTVAKDINGKKIVIFPASDLVAELIDRNFSALSELAIIPHAKGNLKSLMDKAEMVRIAKDAGLQVPYSVKFDLRENPSPHFPLPCIIKPLRSISGDKEDITICRDEQTFSDAITRYKSKGFYEILIQSFVSGTNQEEIAVTGVALPNGEIITHGIVHKKRIRGNGSTVFATFKPDADSELQSGIRRFIAKCGYQGIFDIEFLHNDSGYHFIECNFRNGAYGYAITKSGFNMPHVFSLESLGMRIPEIKLREITFMEERSDLLNVLDHTITPFQWIKDIMSTDTFLWWNIRDSKPMIRIPASIKRLFSKRALS